jgi:nicotinamide-nucleotide amidase
MRASIVCIGSELLQDKINTNVNLISNELRLKLGLRVSRAYTVPDDLEEIKRVLSESISLFDIVITCGGLGPTFDDFTCDAVAQVLGKRRIFVREILENIVRHFIARGIEMPEENERQAYIIEGAKYVLNPVGTAPAQIIDTEVKGHKVCIILLPGPPNELTPIVENDVIPYLAKKIKVPVITKQAVLHIFGKPESEINHKIEPIVKQETLHDEDINVEFGILAHQAIIDVKVYVSGRDQMLVEETLLNIKRRLYEVLEDDIYGEGAQTLSSVVGELLLAKRKTLSVAESATGGLIGNKITNIAGSSVYFRGGVIAYNNEIKMKILGVPEEVIKVHGVISGEVARYMAEGVKKLYRTDCSVGITGIAGPTTEEDKPVGLAYISTIVDNEVSVYEVRFSGLRQEIKDKFANAALNFLYRNLKKLK